MAATQGDDALAWWSNYGLATAQLAAPGVNILSTLNQGDQDYAWLSGTSMVRSPVRLFLFHGATAALPRSFRRG